MPTFRFFFFLKLFFIFFHFDFTLTFVCFSYRSLAVNFFITLFLFFWRINGIFVWLETVSLCHHSLASIIFCWINKRFLFLREENSLRWIVWQQEFLSSRTFWSINMPYYNIMCIVLCVGKRSREREKIIQSQNDKTHINNTFTKCTHRTE